MEVYATSVESPDEKYKRSKNARELYKYLYNNGLIFTIRMQEIVETLSAAKAPKKDGKGNPYVDMVNAHMPLLEAMQTASRKAFKRAFC